MMEVCAGLQIGLETSEARFDETAFSRIEEHLFCTDRNRAMQLNPMKSCAPNALQVSFSTVQGGSEKGMHLSVLSWWLQQHKSCIKLCYLARLLTASST